MTKAIKLTLAVSALALSGTAHAQILNQVMGKLLQPASATAPRTTEAPYQGPANGGFVQPSPAQDAALDKLLNQRIADRALAKVILSAKPIVKRMVMASACGMSDISLNQLNAIRLRPKTYDSGSIGYVSKDFMKYHDARQCTTVARINFILLAANAISADVYHISLSSSESSHQKLTFRNVADSGWLIEDVRDAFTQ